MKTNSLKLLLVRWPPSAH